MRENGDVTSDLRNNVITVLFERLITQPPVLGMYIKTHYIIPLKRGNVNIAVDKTGKSAYN